MQSIHIAASTEYDVIIGSGVLNLLGSKITELGKIQKVMLVSDDTVFGLYGDKISSIIKNEGFDLSCYVFAHGEKSKNLTTYGELLEKMSEFHMTRSDIVVALGGGVVGDLSGFAAATYQRGIRFVQIPTTLLAAVDASVGGKTAVDLNSGKNQVGCFHQPSLVLCDIDTLKTLPIEEYKCGCAEVIKYAMIGSKDFYDELLSKPIVEQYEHVISVCVDMKRQYVLDDEFDNGSRMMLNFGHTFGHAVEQCSGYSVLHGLAVSIGMVIITKSAEKRNICKEGTCEKLLQLLNKYDMPTQTQFTSSELVKPAMIDKKASGKKVNLIVPKEVGECVIMKVDSFELESWIIDGK